MKEKIQIELNIIIMLVIISYYENQVYNESYRHPRRDRIPYHKLGQMERLIYNKVSRMNALLYVELSLSLNIKNKMSRKNNLGGECHSVAIKMINIHKYRGSYFPNSFNNLLT
jgi:hypothetical protein